MSLTDFGWRVNPKLPRKAACLELHTLKFIAVEQNALIIGRPGTGKIFTMFRPLTPYWQDSGLW